MADLSNQLKGTTAVAFFNENNSSKSIKVIVESRESNEAMTERDDNWKAKVYNTATKGYNISDYILAIMVGPKKASYNMRTHVLIQAQKMSKRGEEILVSDAANFAHNYLIQLSKGDKIYKFGTIIAGHDSIMGLQIYRVYIVDKEVHKQEIHMFASFGTGSPYVNHLMVHGYDLNFSNEAAKKFAQQLVFNASFYDKNTDANIHYFEVNEGGVLGENEVHALETYSSFYEEYDESCILFLVYNYNEVIPADDLVALFRPDGDIIVAHVVDHRVTPKSKKFFFHRLVFVSKKEAENVLTSIKDCPLDDVYKKSTILSHFDYQLKWKRENLDPQKKGNNQDLDLFVQKASKQLLDHIISNSTKELDLSV